MMNAPPGIRKPAHQLLWQKIQAFQLDDPEAALPFSRKLAQKQGWDYDYTLGAIAAYRKFIYLCCISPHGASPSAVIDEVWHLHLLYTQNYWEELCEKTLERKLHHHPSKGGPAQKAKHLYWQDDTLQLYRDTFQEEPPSRYWVDDYSPPSPDKKHSPIRSLLQKLALMLLLLPVMLLSGCKGASFLGFLLVPFLLFVIGAAQRQGADTPGGKKKDQSDSGGGSSCSSCGSSCGSGCGGGGCGGCGGS